MKIALLFSLVMTRTLFAAETDTFTHRSESLADSSQVINKMANDYVKVALNDLKEEGCNEARLYEELRKYFANHMNGILSKEIINGPLVIRRDVKILESVYRDWTWLDGIGMKLDFTAKTGLTVSPVIKVGDVLIGTDKFEHFFGQGFAYFTSEYLKEKGLTKTVKTGILKEKIFLGGNKIGNGVFSYADLSANFNGMRFWNHMLQKRDDVLGKEKNLGPYISCADDKWVQVKEFDFTDYMDPSMDEAINCSKFPAESTVKKFVSEVEKLGLSCPVDPHLLDEMKLKYAPVAKWIINEDGPGVVKYFGEFKND